MTDRASLAGVNVLGYLASNSGIGVATRIVIEMIQSQNIPVSLFDVQATEEPPSIEAESAHYPAIRASDVPHGVNLMVLPINAVDSLMSRFENEALRNGRLNVALCFWELPTIPPRWIAPLETLDVIVATSDYICQALRVAISGPAIIAGRLPYKLPADSRSDRARFGIPTDTVAFVSSFEPGSDPRRKNPLGTVQAFLKGVGEDQRAILVLRVKNAVHDGVEHPIMSDLRSQINGYPNVLLIAGELSYTEVLSLYASCDVFVSLHRAEGLGLGMLEAMALGKAVIATGWSGNMSFMDHACACIVRYALVPVDGSLDAYHQDNLEDTTVWAEPDVDHAARWMRFLVDNSGERHAIGRRARERYLEYATDVAAGGFLSEIARIVDQRPLLDLGSGRPSSPKATDLRSSRLARIKQLERELAWLESSRLVRGGRALRRIFGSSAPWMKWK